LIEIDATHPKGWSQAGLGIVQKGCLFFGIAESDAGGCWGRADPEVRDQARSESQGVGDRFIALLARGNCRPLGRVIL
jgi:hypothetical protein